MVDLKCLNLFFSIIITESNINTVKKLFKQTNIVQVEDEDEIEIGEEIDLNFCFEGEIHEDVISMVMLFNGNLIKKPLLRLSNE